MDTATASIIVGIIGAVASVAVAWINRGAQRPWLIFICVLVTIIAAVSFVGTATVPQKSPIGTPQNAGPTPYNKSWEWQETADQKWARCGCSEKWTTRYPKDSDCRTFCFREGVLRTGRELNVK
jgi:hypothetical protein